MHGYWIIALSVFFTMEIREKCHGGFFFFFRWLQMFHKIWGSNSSNLGHVRDKIAETCIPCTGQSFGWLKDMCLAKIATIAKVAKRRQSCNIAMFMQDNLESYLGNSMENIQLERQTPSGILNSTQNDLKWPLLIRQQDCLFDLVAILL